MEKKTESIFHPEISVLYLSVTQNEQPIVFIPVCALHGYMYHLESLVVGKLIDLNGKQ